MDILKYKTEEDFISDITPYSTDKCLDCKGIVEVSMQKLHVIIDNREIEISEIPLLVCKNCGKWKYSYYAGQIVYGYYRELKKRNQLKVISKPYGYRKKYKYAVSHDFLYDHRDYDSIPGLNVDLENGKEGFLTPVYFDKKALVYFISVSEYEVEIFSESYGFIRKKSENSNFQYEWDSPFGFNTNGKLIFWLGDLDMMDDFTLNMLKPFNTNSDHLLVDSEFYQAQLNCIFSDPIKEQQIVINKNIFVSNIKKRFGVDISHLEEECAKETESIVRPLVFTETQTAGVIRSLDKILIEGFNISNLKKLYLQLCPQNQIDKNHEKWQSIKLLEKILLFLSNEANANIDLYNTMSALYLLNDYRICLSHLISGEKLLKTTAHIAKTLGVSDFNKQEEIYFKELEGLDTLFKQLSILS